MLRFYLIATLIVVLVGSVIFARRLTPPDLRISARPTGTPTVESPARRDATTTPPPFVGQGSWVLSALPACFDERSRSRGPAGSLAGDVPPPDRRIAPGTTLDVGPCRIEVRRDDVWIARGGDHLRVPPAAALYRTSDALVLVWQHAGMMEIRRYALNGR